MVWWERSVKWDIDCVSSGPALLCTLATLPCHLPACHCYCSAAMLGVSILVARVAHWYHTDPGIVPGIAQLGQGLDRWLLHSRSLDHQDERGQTAVSSSSSSYWSASPIPGLWLVKWPQPSVDRHVLSWLRPEVLITGSHPIRVYNAAHGHPSCIQ